MAKEIERKFLLEGDGWRTSVTRALDIVQFYLTVEADRSIRVRITDRSIARLTIKFGQGLVRDEFEYEVAMADAVEMRSRALGRVIEKTRFIVSAGDLVFEVDEFRGALDGLIMAELEGTQAVGNVPLPAWVGREVTGDGRYTNAALALETRRAAVA